MTIEALAALDLTANGLRIGIVQARFNEPVCKALRESCLAELKRLGVQSEDIFVCTVPGALEVPLALQNTGASASEFDALVALGAAIRGETYHFEVVANESGAGITASGLDFGIPIANAILTTENDEQAEVRGAGSADAARVAVEMANLGEAIGSLAEVPAEDDE
jgi:6,7-dimethyl-8-ribityllumazine synthase